MLWFVCIFIGSIITIKIYLKLTSKICMADTTLVDKVAIVTGANAGIGFETAKDFVKRGGRVILACRDEQRGKDAVMRILRATGATTHAVAYRHLDLESLASVRKFARQILAEEKRLDILVNNAGVYGFHNRTSEDGIGVEMQVNYFGPFLLTNLLMPLLEKSQPSRIVNVSSLLHWVGKVEFDKLALPSEHDVYANSKLCNILFTLELSRRLRDAGVRVVTNSLHPGAVNTEISRHIRSSSPLRYIMSWLLALLFKNSWEGAQTTIHVALASETAEVSGEYFWECKSAYTSSAARDVTLAKKLWKFSEDLVKLTSNEKYFS